MTNSPKNPKAAQKKFRLQLFRTFLDNLGLGSALAFVAGIVNSVGFIAFGGFVSHVSGNATRAAVEYSEGKIVVAYVFLAAAVFFILGSVFTTILLGGHSIESQKVTFAWPVFIEAIIISFVGVLGTLSGREFFPIHNSYDSLYVHCLTFAMGMQNAILRQASGVVVRTTHMTGVATDIGIAIGSAVCKFFQDFFFLRKARIKNFRSAGFFGFLSTETSSLFNHFKLERFFLHFTVFCSFLFGCVVGACGYLQFSFNVLVCPVSILFVIGYQELHAFRKRKTA